MLDNSPDQGVGAKARRAHQDQHLPGEVGHFLYGLVQLEVGCVNLSILADMIGKSLLLFLLISVNSLLAFII